MAGRSPLGPLPKLVLGEAGARWAVTAAFLACTGALMWTLGVSLSPTAGLATGTVIFGLAAAMLWARFLEDVRDERTRASTAAQPRRFNADIGDAAPVDQPSNETTATLRSTYYDDDSD